MQHTYLQKDSHFSKTAQQTILMHSHKTTNTPQVNTKWQYKSLYISLTEAMQYWASQSQQSDHHEHHHCLGHIWNTDHFAGTIGTKKSSYIISDSRANTYIMGGVLEVYGWKILDIDPHCTASLLHLTAMKIKTQDGWETIWIVCNTICSEQGGPFSLHLNTNQEKWASHQFCFP